MNVHDGIIEKLESFIENNGHLCSPFLESEKDDIRNEVLAEVARMETRIAELESVLKGAGTLIESAMTGERCPNCDNSGCYAEPGRDGDPEPQQCEFCYTVPWSRFNVERLRKRIRLLLEVRT